MSYQIFEIPSYEVQISEKTGIPRTKSIKGPLSAIVKILQTTDKSYHHLFKDTQIYIFYLDIDGCETSEIIENIFFHLLEFFKDNFGDANPITWEDISYTESIKPSGKFSYHISIPKLSGLLSEIKAMVNSFIEKLLEMARDDEIEELASYIDAGVYNNNRWFRLPNQTNAKKPEAHIIKQGRMQDFMYDCIRKDSLQIVLPKEQVKKIAKELKKKGSLTDEEKDALETVNYPVSDEIILQMLAKLDAKHVDEFLPWQRMTHVFKSLNKYEMWKEWSKASANFNAYKNDIIWRNTKKIKFNINYLKNLSKMELAKEYLPLTNLTHPQLTHKIMNHQYLSDGQIGLQYRHLINHPILLLKSCTGTGKTTATLQHVKTYLDANPRYKLLSIVSRITLADQIMDSATKIHLPILSYQKGFKAKQNFIICINSLTKQLLKVKPEDMSNYVLYIDEINSFIKHLTHNENLDPNLKQTFALLKKLIKNAHKIIVSDALISDNVFTFLSDRPQTDSIFYLENTFAKYATTKAIKLNDQNAFLKQIQTNITNSEYFLFGSDCRKTVTEFYNHVANEHQELAEQFILVTSDSQFKILQASEQFKDKYVFYSPTITTAVDFSIDTPQDVFIYIKGNSIGPDESWQQASRTRNMRNLYYYSDAKPHKCVYGNLAEVETYFKDVSHATPAITNLCTNEDDEINENLFFKLFTYNEYVRDTYQTNKTAHFELLLKANQFELSVSGIKTKLDPLTKKEMADQVNVINDELFERYLDTELKCDCDKELDQIHGRVEFLGLESARREILEKFAPIIKDKFQLRDYLNAMRFFKADSYIDSKIELLDQKSLTVKSFDHTYRKIKYIRQFETKYEVNPFDLKCNKRVNFNVDAEDVQHIQRLFHLKKNAPANVEEFKALYVSMVRHIVPSIVKAKQICVQYKRSTVAEFDLPKILEYLELNFYMNSSYKGFRPDFIGAESFTKMIPPELPTPTHDLTAGLDEGIDMDYNMIFD